jgi:DNA-binding CsgD family transcriptional regulator
MPRHHGDAPVFKVSGAGYALRLKKEHDVAKPTNAQILSDFATLVAECLACGEPDSFAATLIAGLRRLTPIEDATVLHYGNGDLPTVVYREVPALSGADTLQRFLQGPFLLDPYYQAAQSRRFGLFRLDELAPEKFRESEYYRSWYRNCGYSDECGYLVDLGAGAFVNIALGRLGRRRFSDRQTALLRSIAPAIDGLCRQQWPRVKSGGDGLRRQLHGALDKFGSSLLTDREKQVINLVLHGHSTKTVAESLGISMETVKLHRKHAYAKLEVSSQAELFYLFLDSLMHAGDYRGGDTLTTYQRPVESVGS